jgi:hypothetical protein
LFAPARRSAVLTLLAIGPERTVYERIGNTPALSVDIGRVRPWVWCSRLQLDPKAFTAGILAIL